MQAAKRCRIGLEKCVSRRHSPLRHILATWRCETRLMKEKRAWFHSTDCALQRSAGMIAAANIGSIFLAWHRNSKALESSKLISRQRGSQSVSGPPSGVSFDMKDCSDLPNSWYSSTSSTTAEDIMNPLHNAESSGPINAWFPSGSAEPCTLLELDACQACDVSQAPSPALWTAQELPHFDIDNEIEGQTQGRHESSGMAWSFDSIHDDLGELDPRLIGHLQEEEQQTTWWDKKLVDKKLGLHKFFKSSATAPMDTGSGSDQELDADPHVSFAQEQTTPTAQYRTPPSMSTALRGSVARSHSTGRLLPWEATRCGRDVSPRETPRSTAVPVSTSDTPRDRSLPRGPERFYYDRASYTGTARRSVGDVAAPPAVRRTSKRCVR